LGKKKQASKELARWCARIAMDKIASDIVVIELTEIETAPADYFVLCSCDSDVQMRAIVDEVEQRCKKEGVQKPRVEGITSAYWILLDFFDIVFHIFHYNARKFYNIERLWGDGNFYKLSKDGKLFPVRDKTKFLTEGKILETV
jgi:ribosome-associated protein